jgi:DNA-binding transcriptional LysR family regulator
MELTSLDLNLLVVLDALLEERHVTRAGERVGLSQPATSNALSRLRRLFDDPLLVRSGNTMQLTVRARQLRDQVRPALEALRDALDEPVEFDPAHMSVRMRVATTDHPLLVLLPQLERRLLAESPGSVLEIHSLGVIDGPAMLREDRLDLLIGTYERLSPQLRKELLFTEELVCLVRRGHPVIAAMVDGALPLDAYLAHPHLRIAPVHEDPGPVARALAERGLERSVVCETPSYLSAPFVVAEADLILVVGERVARRFEALMDLVVVRPPVELPAAEVHLVWHPRLDNSPPHQWFRGVVIDVANQLDR